MNKKKKKAKLLSPSHKELPRNHRILDVKVLIFTLKGSLAFISRTTTLFQITAILIVKLHLLKSYLRRIFTIQLEI